MSVSNVLHAPCLHLQKSRYQRRKNRRIYVLLLMQLVLQTDFVLWWIFPIVPRRTALNAKSKFVIFCHIALFLSIYQIFIGERGCATIAICRVDLVSNVITIPKIILSSTLLYYIHVRYIIIYTLLYIYTIVH